MSKKAKIVLRDTDDGARVIQLRESNNNKVVASYRYSPKDRKSIYTAFGHIADEADAGGYYIEDAETE